MIVGFSSIGISYAQPPPHPKWATELKSYGWRAPKAESNKGFFRDFSIPKLEALDQNTKISFINDDIVVAYHTRQEGQDWHTASRHLEAFFINAKDGRLLSTKDWLIAVRGSGSDLRDSEGRLIPVNSGRFIVFANRTMKLYGADLELIKQQELKPSTPGDLWSAQSLPTGQTIFLRHQSSSEQRTEYFWLAPDTLIPLSQMAGPRGPDFSVVATAGGDFVLGVFAFSSPGITTGLGKTSSDGSRKVICSDQLCREDHTLTMVSPRCVAISGRRGIGVVDTDLGLLWSKQIPSQANPNDFQFGAIQAAMSANKFATWITAHNKTQFDGVPLNHTPTLVLYDGESGKVVFTVPIKPGIGNFDFALSPTGGQVAIFDGARISLYVIPDRQ